MKRQIALRLARLLSLLMCSVLGASSLMYCAPGYFADAREMDASHASVTRSDLQARQKTESSVAALMRSEMTSWRHGDLGISRQFGVPVTELLRERAGHSATLLLSSVLLGWSLALIAAILVSLRRASVTELLAALVAAVLLALPVGALATVCLIANFGGPVAVLASAVAVRDFKLLLRMLQSVWRAPHVLQARAQGCSSRQILRSHIAISLRRELLSMAVLSFTLALSALIPVEVVFDFQGIGQLAWSAATNRDLPVLAAITCIMALCIGVMSMNSSTEHQAGDTLCA